MAGSESFLISDRRFAYKSVSEFFRIYVRFLPKMLAGEGYSANGPHSSRTWAELFGGKTNFRPQRLGVKLLPPGKMPTFVPDRKSRKNSVCSDASGRRAFRPAVRFSGDGIVSASAPGMAAGQPPDGEPAPFQRTVFTQRLQGVLRAGRREAARRGRKRRDAQLVEAHEDNQRQGAEPFTCVGQPTPESGGRHGRWFCRAGPLSKSK